MLRTLLFVGLLVWASSAPAQAPTLTHFFPAGAQRGAKVLVTCHGVFPTWPIQVDAPGVTAVASKEKGKLEITLPNDLATDRIWIRVYDSAGSSVARPLLVGGLAEAEEKEPNNDVAQAEVAAAATTFNGVLTGGDVDHFAIDAQPGQTIVADLAANTKLGSPMDAVLQLVDAAGFVLAESHDDQGLDPRLAFTANKAGRHFVRLFAFPSTPDSSIQFSGGPNYVYRLTVTTGPFIDFAFPAGAEKATLFGWNLPNPAEAASLPFFATAPESRRERPQPFGQRPREADPFRLVHRVGFASEARIRIPAGSVLVQPSTYNPGDPPTLSAPGSIFGRLQNPGAWDVYRLPLKKGASVSISASRVSGAPLDPVLRLLAPTGAVAAELDDTGESRDVEIHHVVGADGVYQVAVRDLYRKAGPRFAYQIVVRVDEPDFDLTTAAEEFVVTPDKPAEIAITIARRAVNNIAPGPIQLRVVGLPPTITAEPATSAPTGPTATAVTLRLKSTGQTFAGPIQILGESQQPKLVRIAHPPSNLGVTVPSLWLSAPAKK